MAEQTEKTVPTMEKLVAEQTARFEAAVADLPADGQRLVEVAERVGVPAHPLVHRAEVDQRLTLQPAVADLPVVALVHQQDLNLLPRRGGGVALEERPGALRGAALEEAGDGDARACDCARRVDGTLLATEIAMAGVSLHRSSNNRAAMIVSPP